MQLYTLHMQSTYCIPTVFLRSELQQQVVVLLKALNGQCPAEMQAAIVGLTPDQLATLNTALQTTPP